MSNDYVGKGGKRYALGTRLGGGGEGDILEIRGMPDCVAKIYILGKNPNLVEKEKKLMVMLASPPPAGTSITWPKDLLYDIQGKFVGFVMPRIQDNVKMNEIYESPSTKYPDMPYKHRIIIARNMCDVLNSVHSVGFVVGDLNPDNILVNQTGMVTFCDTDSYHISDGSNTYRCTVGKADYYAREVAIRMQGYDPSTAPLPTFTQESDDFALAVLIFQILMNGAHPFSGAVSPLAKTSVAVPLPSEAIMKGESPFINPRNTSITIPSYAPEYKSLPSYVRDLFKRAFIDGSTDPKARPKPDEWIVALEKYSRELTRCKSVSYHSYYNGLSSCPLCEADARDNAVAFNTAFPSQIPNPMPPSQPRSSLSYKINSNPVVLTNHNRNPSKKKVILAFLVVYIILQLLAVYSVYQYDTSIGEPDGWLEGIIIVIPSIIAICSALFGFGWIGSILGLAGVLVYSVCLIQDPQFAYIPVVVILAALTTPVCIMVGRLDKY